jgi:hypothetical protein
MKDPTHRLRASGRVAEREDLPARSGGTRRRGGRRRPRNGTFSTTTRAQRREKGPTPRRGNPRGSSGRLLHEKDLANAAAVLGAVLRRFRVPHLAPNRSCRNDSTPPGQKSRRRRDESTGDQEEGLEKRTGEGRQNRCEAAAATAKRRQLTYRDGTDACEDGRSGVGERST